MPSLRKDVYKRQKGDGIGNMQIGTENKTVYFSIGPAVTIEVYMVAAEEKRDYIEHWTGDFDKEDSFTATVKETTYFEVGQKINFFRVDDDEGQN